jgi:hypothetical protein
MTSNVPRREVTGTLVHRRLHNLIIHPLALLLYLCIVPHEDSHFLRNAYKILVVKPEGE